MELTLEQVSYKYGKGTPLERKALDGVSFTIPEGSYTAIIGHTGSGKSTVLQHLNALLQPTEGRVTIGNRVITSKVKAKNLKDVRRQVGIVFQFPEHQLFEESVLKDIMYGPMNFGITEQEAKERAKKYVNMVGLDYDVLSSSPFDLSGGQMRRVAIAGVLAMNPDVIVLDEPTAGLDPRGREDIMNMFQALHREEKKTTVLVTHSMEDAAKYADHLIILSKGKVMLEGSPREIFTMDEELRKLQLDIPETVRFQRELRKKVMDSPSLNYA